MPDALPVTQPTVTKNCKAYNPTNNFSEKAIQRSVAKKDS